MYIHSPKKILVLLSFAWHHSRWYFSHIIMTCRFAGIVLITWTTYGHSCHGHGTALILSFWVQTKDNHPSVAQWDLNQRANDTFRRVFLREGIQCIFRTMSTHICRHIHVISIWLNCGWLWRSKQSNTPKIYDLNLMFKIIQSEYNFAASSCHIQK